MVVEVNLTHFFDSLSLQFIERTVVRRSFLNPTPNLDLSDEGTQDDGEVQ